MAATIVVAPARLRQAAAAASAVGARLLEVRGQLAAGVAVMDTALGGPEARSAFAALWARWSVAVDGLAGDLVAVAVALDAAAEAYQRADRDSLPDEAEGARTRGGR